MIYGTLTDVITKLKENSLDFLFAMGNIKKIVPIFKLRKIINLVKEYGDRLEKDSISIDEDIHEYLKDNDISLVVSFNKNKDIKTELKNYKEEKLKDYMEVSVSDIGDLEELITILKEIFDIESIKLYDLVNNN